MAVGILSVRYKDKYAHPAAAWAVLVIFVLAGFLIALNTYRDRSAAKIEKKKTTETLEYLSKTVRELRQEGTAAGDKTKQSLDKIAGDLGDFKEKVRPDELRNEMSGLRSTMQKVVSPPKAELLFSFAPVVEPPRDDRTIIPIREVTLPLQPDGSVQAHIMLINNTEVPADGTQVAVEICEGCKFTKEPAKFTRVEGSPDTMRNYNYGDVPAGGPFEALIIDITPPPNVAAFNIEVSHRCKTCVLQRKGNIGTVHIQRN